MARVEAARLPVERVPNYSATEVPRPLTEALIQEQQEQTGTGTELQALVTVVKVCIGTGVLALPFAMQQAGIIFGVVGLGFIAAWNAFMCMCLLDCQSTLQSQGVDLTKDKSIFSAMARHAMGKIGVQLLDFSLVFTTLGVCSVYQLTAGQLLDSAGMVLLSSSWNPRLCTILCAALIYPLTLPKSLEFLSKAAAFGLLSLLVGFIVIFYDGARHGQGLGPASPAMLAGQSVKGVSVYFGIAAFSYGIPGMVFPIQSGMQCPEKIRGAITFGVAVVFMIYSILGVFGYMLYATNMNQNILESLPRQAVATKLVLVAQALMLIFTTPLPFSLSAQMIRQVFARKPAISFGVRTFAFWTTTLVAVTVPEFGLVLSFIGCFAISLYSFILPPLMHLQVCGHTLSWKSRSLDWFCFACGMITMLTTSAMTLTGMVDVPKAPSSSP